MIDKTGVDVIKHYYKIVKASGYIESYATLAENTQWSADEIRSILSKLSKDNITINKRFHDNKFRYVITKKACDYIGKSYYELNLQIKPLSPTKKQLEFLGKWHELRLKIGIPPTQEEMRIAMGFNSNNSAVDYLRALVKKQLLLNSDKKARGYELTELGANYLGISLFDNLKSDNKLENELLNLFNNLSSENQSEILEIARTMSKKTTKNLYTPIDNTTKKQRTFILG